MDKEMKLAKMIVSYSIDALEDENILISYEDVKAERLVKYLIKEIKERKANPFVRLSPVNIHNMLLENINDKAIKVLEKELKFDVDNYDSFISIRSNNNDYEGSDISSDVRKKILKKTLKYKEIKVNDKKWVLLNYPTSLDANKAHMSTEKFYDYAFSAMCYDYRLMNEDIKPLKELVKLKNSKRI